MKKHPNIRPVGLQQNKANDNKTSNVNKRAAINNNSNQDDGRGGGGGGGGAVRGGFARLQIAANKGPVVATFDEEDEGDVMSIRGRRQHNPSNNSNNNNYNNNRNVRNSMELRGESEYLHIGGNEADVISGDQLDRLAHRRGNKF